MPRKMSKRERLLRKRWPKWQFCVEGYRGHYGGWARLPSKGLYPVDWPHVRPRICTRRSDAWRSLERAMRRTKRALEPVVSREERALDALMTLAFRASGVPVTDEEARRLVENAPLLGPEDEAVAASIGPDFIARLLKEKP